MIDMMYDRWLQRDGRGLVGAKEGHSTAKVSSQLSIYLFTYIPIYLSVYLSIYLSIYLSTFYLSISKVSRQQEDELIRTENLADSAEFLQTSKIAEALGRRLERDQRYTYIGDILLAVNPPSVDEKLLEGLESSEPHIVNMVRGIRSKMLHFRQPQLLLTAGWEGSGRANIYSAALRTLLHTGTGQRGAVCSKIAAADSVLATFTSRGDTASPVVRVTRVWHNTHGAVTGADFSSCHAAAATELAAAWRQYEIFDVVIAGLRGRGQASVREHGLEHVIQEDAVTQQDAAKLGQFRQLVTQLQLLGFRPEHGLSVVLRVTASIVLLLRLAEAPGPAPGLVRAVASNLEVDPALLQRSLTSLSTTARPSFTQEQSSLGRSAASLARLLYTSLLDWMEHFINTQLRLRWVPCCGRTRESKL